MQTVILVVHILASIALTAVVLLQRSEGGALGIGGGGPGGGLMSGRGAAGALVRTTMIFAAVFFVTSLGLTTIAARSSDGVGGSVVDDAAQSQGVDPSDLTDPNYNPLDDPALRNPLDDADAPLVESEPFMPLDDAPATQPDAATGAETAPQGTMPDSDQGDPQ